MANVLANLKSGNLEEVDNPDEALKSGSHGIPLYNPQGQPHIAANMDEASTLMGQGWKQPAPEQLQAGLDRAKVNTTGEKIGSFVEGGGEGAGAVYTGVPLFTAAEVGAGKLLGIKELSPEYIALRHKYNKAEEIGGNVVGAGAATYFGGEATLPFTLPKMAEAGLAKAFGSQLAPLGSLAVKGMVQSALFSGNQELGKFLYDPSQTAEKAISNVTLNSALGGIGGAAIGSIPAMWEKTAEAINTSKFLTGLKAQANVTPAGQNLPDAFSQSGMNLGAGIKAQASKSGFVARMGKAVTQPEEIGDYNAQAQREMVRGLGVEPEGAEILKAGGDSEAATPIRAAVAGKAKALYNAQAQAWEKADAPLQGAIVPPEAAAAHADAVAAVQGEYAALKNTTPTWNAIESAKKDLPNLKTLSDFQKWRSGVLDSVWNPKNPQAYWQMKTALNGWEDQFKETALGALNPENVGMLQEARKASSDMYSFMRSASTAMKLAKPGRPSEWISDLESAGKITDSQFLSKAIPADNDSYLQWVQQNVPEAADSLKNAYRYQAIQKSLTGGEINPKKLFNYVTTQWSPETQKFVLPEQVTNPDGSVVDGLSKMAVIKDIMDATGRKMGGGFAADIGQAAVDRMLHSMSGGVGAIIGHTIGGPAGAAVGYGVGKLAGNLGVKAIDAGKLSLLRYLENGVIDVPAFKGMADFFENAVAGHAAMAQGVASVLSGKPEIPRQAQPDYKAADKLGQLMDSYQKDPSQMYGIGGSLGTYLPDHHIAVAGVAGRAAEFLNALRPKTDPMGVMDSPIQLSQMDKAKYQRALNLVNKPLSILHHIKQGNITDEDMGALEVYPGLKDQLHQHFLQGIADMKAKGKKIPYQQRLALSRFMGMNLDSTIGGMTMLSLMQGKQQGGQQPHSGGKGGKKPPQSAFTKMTQGANTNMTMAQKAEQDRVTPQ